MADGVKYPVEVFLHRYQNPFGEVEYDVIEPGEMAEAVSDGDIVSRYQLMDTYTVHVQVSLEDQRPVEASDVPF